MIAAIVIVAATYLAVGGVFAYTLSRSGTGSGTVTKLETAKTVITWPRWFIRK